MQNLIKYFKRYRIRVMVLIVLGLLLYGVTLRNQLFWDDNDFILNNRYIQDWGNVGKFFSQNLIAGAGLVSNYWRPVLLMIFAGQWSVWGDWAAGYHLTNMLFHIGNALLLYSLLRTILKSKTVAWLVAIIFLIHPLQTEAVTYANSLGDSLSTFFVFSGLLLYLKFRRAGESIWKSWTYWLSVICYGLALMTKETAIIMPGLIMLIDYFTLSPADTFWPKAKAILKRTWPFIVIAVAYLILRGTALDFNNSYNFYTDGSEYGTSLYVRLLTFGRIFITYIGLMLAPWTLHMERTVVVAKSIFEPMVITGWLSIMAIIWVAVKSYRRLPAVTLGVAWFLVALIPVSNILVPINGMLYEHWLYVPLVGFFIAVLSVGIWLYAKRKYRSALLTLLAIMIIFFCVRTVMRNIEWADPVVLYTQTLKFAPDSYRVINNLGMEYAKRGDTANADKYYRRAIAVDDSIAVAYHNLANLRRDAGQYDAAITLYQTALNQDANFVYATVGLAETYELKQDYQNAIIQYEKLFATYQTQDLASKILDLAKKTGDTERVNRYTDMLGGNK